MHYSYPVHSQALGILLKYYPIIQGQVGLWTGNLQLHCATPASPPLPPSPSCARPRTAADRRGLSATWQRGASVVEGGEARTVERWSVPFFNRTGNATAVRILLRGVTSWGPRPFQRSVLYRVPQRRRGPRCNIKKEKREKKKKKKKSPMTASPLPS